MNDSSLDTSKCPLCGQPNICPMVVDPHASQCWCEDKYFPPELLARVPGGAARKACICMQCLHDFIESQVDNPI
jgi:hypothetical protein